ncbi:unnamed protein product [Trichobilharzia szidati]|nr:unnamed protein product [Trichobilharzia szidati]
MDQQQMIDSLKKNEIKLGDKETYQNIKYHAELNVLPEKTDIDFVINLENKVELSVVLPDGYPSWNSCFPVKPLVTLRLLSSSSSSSSESSNHGINVRELSSRFNQWLDETANSGEPVLVASIDWLQNEFINGTFMLNETVDAIQTNQSLLDNNNNDNNKPCIACLWIISHHIRSPIKRRLILEWSKELDLTGCCMPGRPGLIVVEGEESKADEYWRRLRSLQWKHIQLREKEILGTGLYQHRRFTDGFHELALSQQSWFQWLNQHKVTSEEYKRIFGIPGRLPTSK